MASTPQSDSLTVCSSDTCNVAARFHCEICTRDFCTTCRVAHDIPVSNKDHVVSEITERTPEPKKCSACRQPATYECGICDEVQKFMCYRCRGSWHNVLFGSHAASVVRLQASLPRGRKALPPGQLVKHASSSKSRRLSTALRHDREFRQQFRVNTLRILVHKSTIGKIKRRTKWSCVVTGSKTLVDGFRKGKFVFGSNIQACEGGETEWKVDINNVFDSPELTGFDDATKVDRSGFVSPAKANVYSTPRILTRSASRASSVGVTSDTPRSTVTSSVRPPNPLRAARPLDFNLDLESPEKDEPEPNDGFMKVNGDPYEDMSATELSQEIWKHYPDYERDGVASVVKELQTRFEFDKDLCIICNKKTTRGLMRQWVRCIGVMDRMMCHRRAHRLCAKRELFLCKEKGCSSEHDSDLSKKLALLFFNSKTQDLREDDSLSKEVKKFKQNTLAKNTSSLLLTLSMQ